MNKEYIIDEVERILLRGIDSCSNKKESIEEYRVLYENEILRKFSRSEFYNEIQRLIVKYDNNDDMLNELYEIELTIIGHCSELGIQSFIGDPDPNDREILIPYVRSLTWKR
ncbi:hypothetical protein H5V55_001095 [Salmonella enterica]|nr:hypothetical protein [Salmonella enterica]